MLRFEMFRVKQQLLRINLNMFGVYLLAVICTFVHFRFGNSYLHYTQYMRLNESTV